MAASPQPSELRNAAHELERYLSDDIAPLMAAGVFDDLLPHPPQIAARVIAAWIEWQLSGPSAGVPVSDLVFHALRKIHLLAEFGLVPRDALVRYLNGVGRILLQGCPPSERDALKIRLSHLGETETVLASRAQLLHKEAGALAAAAAKAPAGEPATAADDAAARSDPKAVGRGAKALSLLLERLGKLEPSTGDRPAADSPDGALLARILATAAIASRSDADLARHLEEVKKRGYAAPMGEIFRALSGSLPGWTAVSESGEVLANPPARSLQAMNRIVALAPGPEERAKRWGEMIYAAIEQLNQGRLAQAVSILEAAKMLIASTRPDPSIVGQVLQQSEQAISEPVLKRLVENPAKHGLVRKVLEAFPSLRPEGLLASLDGEMRRDRRKLLLALLECHGPSCRGLVLDRLAAVLGGTIPDPLGYFRRNLAFLLRRIPRSRNERLEEELRLLAAMVQRGEPAIAAKEAAGALGQIHATQAERILVDRLRELEAELAARGGDPEGWEMLDRLCAAISRHGSPRAIRAVASHAFAGRSALGDTMSRFEHLSRLDLTVDPEQLAVLLQSIRDLLPKKVLGLAVTRPPHELASLVEAVSGTSTSEVRSVLQDVAARFKGQPLGDTATKALAKVEPRSRPAASSDALSGDLELFGLPGILQSLAGQKASGELVLFDRRQGRQGALGLVEGGVVRAEAGRLRGAPAVYLLMERPVEGTFSFRTAATPARPAAGAALEAMSLILEGARRHDEYQLARAIAPDGVRLAPAGIPALRPDDEEDGDFAGTVWDRAAAGTPPETCEAEMEIDPFRVRRLYALWVEAGALRPRAEA